MLRPCFSLRFAAPLLTALSACSSSPAPEVPVYPAAALSPAVPSLTLAEGVTTLDLVCGATEVDNAVDDDCDGHIDESFVPATGELELALTWAADVELELTTEPALDAEPQRSVCEPPQACVLRLVSAELPPHSELSVRLSRWGTADDQEPGGEPVTVSLSVAALGTDLGTHNLALSPGESREVARLTVP